MERGAHGAIRGRRRGRGGADGLMARDEVDDVMDGFVYGALCGLGFAVVEDVFYFLAVFGGDVGGVFRVLRAGDRERPLLHVLYTGLVGIAVGVIVTRREAYPGPRRIRPCWPAPRSSPTSCGTHRCWSSSAQPWEAPSGC